MSNTRLRAADLADEFRSISSDKRMEYVPVRANHLLIAADMLDANDELLMRLNAEYLFRQNIAAENVRLRELLQRTWDAFHAATAREFVTVKNELRELGVEVDA